jgi:tetratricopeptide (TPR) repeat protein
VNFAVFDAWAQQLGFRVTRSHVPLRGLHQVAIAYGEADVDAAFDEAFVRAQWGEDLLDFISAAQDHARAGNHRSAIRMLRRALALDPASAELHHHLGEECVDGGFPDLAMDYLEAGQALGDPDWDFEFLLGRACFDLDRIPEAIEWLRASSAHGDHSTTRLNLALAYRDLGQIEAAYAECRESLALDPDSEQAQTLLAELRERLGPANGRH